MIEKLKFCTISLLSSLMFISCATDSQKINNSTQQINTFNANQTGKSIDLDILTFNIWGVDVSISPRRRLQETPKSLEGFDFINLQEVTSDNSKKMINDIEYPHKVIHNDKKTFKYSSGLVSLSKYEIVEKKFMSFKTCSFWDCQNNKGVQFMRINIPEFGNVDIYNTHYQSLEKYYRDRLIANAQFWEFFRENNQGNPAIVTGDFNFIDKSLDYKDLVEKLKPVDSFRFINKDEKGYTYNAGENSYSFFKNQRLDYIFLISGEKGNIKALDSKVIFDERVNGVFLSDHFGVNTKVRLTSK